MFCRRHLPIIIVCSLFIHAAYPVHDHYFSDAPQEKLNDPILKKLDGVPLLFNGPTIRDMICVNAKIFRLQYGVVDQETGELRGLYTFNGVPHSLHSLAELDLSYEEEYKQKLAKLEMELVDTAAFTQEWPFVEQQVIEKTHEELEQELHPTEYHLRRSEERKIKRLGHRRLNEELEETKAMLKRKYARDIEAYDTALSSLQEVYEQKIAALHPLLLQIRDDFAAIMVPFTNVSKGAKPYMLKLIYEWSQLQSDRWDTPLLRWEEIEDGAEVDTYFRDVDRLWILDQFCSDERSLIKAIIHSCPKGYAQYLELRKGQGQK